MGNTESQLDLFGISGFYFGEPGKTRVEPGKDDFCSRSVLIYRPPSKEGGKGNPGPGPRFPPRLCRGKPAFPFPPSEIGKGAREDPEAELRKKMERLKNEMEEVGEEIAAISKILIPVNGFERSLRGRISETHLDQGLMADIGRKKRKPLFAELDASRLAYAPQRRELRRLNVLDREIRREFDRVKREIYPKKARQP